MTVQSLPPATAQPILDLLFTAGTNINHRNIAGETVLDLSSSSLKIYLQEKWQARSGKSTDIRKLMRWDMTRSRQEMPSGFK